MPLVMGNKTLLPSLIFLVLVLVVFYPSLALQRVLAPQALLWNFPPWSDIAGPNPVDRPEQLQQAFTLAPRLHLLQKHGWEIAYWNPFIGNGRVGFLSFAADGYPPLAVLAAARTSPIYQWNVLLLIELTLTFWGAFLLSRQFLSPEASSLAAVAYSLSGPVLSHWNSLGGSVAAFGPWLWLAALTRRPLLGASMASLLLLSGGDSWPFLAGYIVLASWVDYRSEQPRWLPTFLWVLVMAFFLAFPSLFMSFFGGESPGLWWLKASPKSPSPWSALVAASPLPDLVAGPSLYFGWPLLTLALAGLFRCKGLGRLGLWAFGVAACLVFYLPKDPFPFFAGFRPIFLLALGAALLAGLGAEGYFRYIPKTWHQWAWVLLNLFVAVPLLTAGARYLPWEEKSRVLLPTPWGQVPWAVGELNLPLLTLFPPDSAAFLGLCDPRAYSFPAEPRYRGLLNPADDGSIHFSRITEPTLSELGVKWLIEPEEPQVVRETLGAKTIVGEVRRDKTGYNIAVPPHATKLGLPLDESLLFLSVEQGGRRIILPPKEDFLTDEDWRFWQLPSDMRSGDAKLLADSDFLRRHPLLTIAWDVSGWEQITADRGVRIWRQRFARPLAAWVDESSQQVPPKVLHWRPGSITLLVSTKTEQRLALRIKHRPKLLRITVDEKEARFMPSPQVWTEITVPPGEHKVNATFTLPIWVWAFPVIAAVLLWRFREAFL